MAKRTKASKLRRKIIRNLNQKVENLTNQLKEKSNEVRPA